MTPDDGGESPQGHHANMTALVQDVGGGGVHYTRVGAGAVCELHTSRAVVLRPKNCS